MTVLGAVIVVPAHNEVHRIDRCLRALGAQRGVAPEAYEIVVAPLRSSSASAV